MFSCLGAHLENKTQVKSVIFHSKLEKNLLEVVEFLRANARKAVELI